MPRHDLAESILSLVMPPDRAASLVGDLLEDTRRGSCRFWTSVTRVMLCQWSRTLTVAPLKMAGFAFSAWFLYMAVSLFLWVAGVVSVRLLWGVPYWLMHHTGLELLSDALRLRLEFTSPPAFIAHGIELLMLTVVAPLYVGRITAMIWRGQELAAWSIMSLTWPFLAILIPFAASSVRLSLPLIAVVQVFVLLGVLQQHFGSNSAKAQTA